MIEKQVDLLIIGGGLVGLTLLSALQASRFKVLLVDKNKFLPSQVDLFDSRTLALAPASIAILQTLGIWQLIHEQAIPISTIHISAARHFGATRLNKKANEPLGYVVEIPHLYNACAKLANLDNILAPVKVVAVDQNTATVTVQSDSKKILIKTKLIIAADGTNSAVRDLAKFTKQIKNFDQHAIVANLKLARSHANQAFERFTPNGPIALLPMSDRRVSLIWCSTLNKAESLLAMQKREFLNCLQQNFGYRVGRFQEVGRRALIPLQQTLMPNQFSWPLVFLGNSAHTLHPVAGQGFNLGLRDLASLAQCIYQYGLNSKMLSIYQNMRNNDQKSIIDLTNIFLKTFASTIPGALLIRSVGLVSIDNIPMVQEILMHFLCGYVHPASDFACGIFPRSLTKND